MQTDDHKNSLLRETSFLVFILVKIIETTVDCIVVRCRSVCRIAGYRYLI